MSEVTAAPTEATASTPEATTAATPAPPVEKPVDPRIELEAALKKAGGLKVKAGGKEHTIDSLDKALRLMQRGLPVEQSLEEVARQKSELAPVQELLAQLQSGDEEAAESALEKLLDSGKLDKVAERRLRRQFEREKSMEGLSPRERELAAALEQERAEKSKLTEERTRAQKEREAAIERQQVEAIQNHMAGVIDEAFKLLDLGDGRLDAMALDFMKPIIRSALNAGMPLDPQVLADKVGPMLESLHKRQLIAAKSKPYLSEAVQEALKEADDATLLKFFGTDIGKKYRKALLGQLSGGAPAQPKTQGEAPAPPAQRWDPRRVF